MARALAIYRGHRATLLIAKLDRLARNVHFISIVLYLTRKLEGFMVESSGDRHQVRAERQQLVGLGGVGEPLSDHA